MRQDIDAAKAGSYLIVSPWVIEMNNVLTSEFRNAVLDHANDELRFTIEKSNTGTSSIRASIYREPTNEIWPDLKDGGETPIVKNGAKGVPAVPSSEKEYIINQLLEDVNNLFLRRTNEVMLALFNAEDKRSDRENRKKREAIDRKEGHPKKTTPLVPDSATFLGLPEKPIPPKSLKILKQKTSRKVLRTLLPLFLCRLLLLKSGKEAAYGFHRDVTWTMNSRNAEAPTYVSGGETALPTAMQMCVPTLAIARDGYNRLTELVHSGLKDSRKEEDILSRVYTGRCSIHIQSPGCQGCYLPCKFPTTSETTATT
jgi:hypothetical protein